MRNSLIIVLIFFLPLLPKTEGILIEHDNFRVDNLGRFQVLNNGSLDLYDANAKIIGHHSENLLGRITTMDRVSELKLLVFYADIPAFQLLDNTLSPHSEVYDLNTEGMGNITAVCMSANNTFWGYDGVQFELIRFDDNYRVLSRSGNTALTAGRVLDPVRMIEHDGRLYVADSQEGVFVFDQFGTYVRTLPYKGLVDIDIDGNMIYMTDGKAFDRAAVRSKILEPSKSDLESVTCFDVVAKKVFLGDGKRIKMATLDSLFD